VSILQKAELWNGRNEADEKTGKQGFECLESA
jgi:hypothetical protein